MISPESITDQYKIALFNKHMLDWADGLAAMIVADQEVVEGKPVYTIPIEYHSPEPREGESMSLGLPTEMVLSALNKELSGWNKRRRKGITGPALPERNFLYSHRDCYGLKLGIPQRGGILTLDDKIKAIIRQGYDSVLRPKEEKGRRVWVYWDLEISRDFERGITVKGDALMLIYRWKSEDGSLWMVRSQEDYDLFEFQTDPAEVLQGIIKLERKLL